MKLKTDFFCKCPRFTAVFDKFAQLQLNMENFPLLILKVLTRSKFLPEIIFDVDGLRKSSVSM